MAEVKTYKCDICGEVYHVDDSQENRVMDLADITNGNKSRDVKHYEHICDKCAGEIRSIIRNPELLSELYKESKLYRELAVEYAGYLRDVYGESCESYAICRVDSGCKDTTAYKAIMDVTKENIKGLKIRNKELYKAWTATRNYAEKLERCAFVAYCGLGCLVIGMIISLFV